MPIAVWASVRVESVVAPDPGRVAVVGCARTREAVMTIEQQPDPEVIDLRTSPTQDGIVLVEQRVGANAVDRVARRIAIIDAADARDQRAEKRDRAANARDVAAALRKVSGRPSTQQDDLDRSCSAADRVHSGVDRDLDAGDRADLIDLGREAVECD